MNEERYSMSNCSGESSCCYDGLTPVSVAEGVTGVAVVVV